MGRCDRRCMAIGIKRSLSKIDKMMVREAMKIEVDALMYEFARLHGIGVIPDEISNSTTSYTFLSDPESRIDTGFRMNLVFANHCVNVNWDTVDGSYLDRALKQVTIYLNLRNWEEYLEPDYVIPPMRLPWDPLHPEKTRHDDSLDAMRYMLPCVTNNGPTPKEEIDKIIDAAMRKTGLTPVVVGPYAACCEVRKNMDVASMHPKFSDSILRYCKEDWKKTMNLYKRLEEEKKNTIKKVIFHDPATIIYWEDGTKTVVKVQNGEKFDPEKGMAMAICKKTHGNDGSYYEAFKKFLPKEEKVGVFDFDVCLHVFAEIQNLEIVGPDPESGVIKLIDMLNDDRVYAVVDRKTITADEWDALHDKMLKYFKSPAPKDLNNISDAVTIDTEAEQYTGEAPKEASDNRMTINDALLSLMRDTGCLNVTFVPDSGRYCIEKRDCIEMIPYYVYVESPTEEISLERYTQLKLDIRKHFDISDAVTIDTGEAPKVRMRESTIDEELKEFAAISGLTVNYEPKTGRYYIFKHQHCKPFVYKADSPEKKLSCLEWAKLQDDIFEYFDI